jgi:hypothetical protein
VLVGCRASWNRHGTHSDSRDLAGNFDEFDRIHHRGAIEGR